MTDWDNMLVGPGAIAALRQVKNESEFPATASAIMWLGVYRIWKQVCNGEVEILYSDVDHPLVIEALEGLDLTPAGVQWIHQTVLTLLGTSNAHPARVDQG